MVECVSALVGTGKLMIGCRRSCRPSHGCGGGVASEVGGGGRPLGENRIERLTGGGPVEYDRLQRAVEGEGDLMIEGPLIRRLAYDSTD